VCSNRCFQNGIDIMHPARRHVRHAYFQFIYQRHPQSYFAGYSRGFEDVPSSIVISKALLQDILEDSKMYHHPSSSPKLFCRIFSSIRKCSIIHRHLQSYFAGYSRGFENVPISLKLFVLIIFFAGVFLIIQILRDSLLRSNCSKLNHHDQDCHHLLLHLRARCRHD
jgi:hypothetical protein